MKLLKRLKIAFKYNFDDYFVVVPIEDKMRASKFLKYEDAVEFANNTPPQYPPLNVFIAVDFGYDTKSRVNNKPKRKLAQVAPTSEGKNE